MVIKRQYYTIITNIVSLTLPLLREGTTMNNIIKKYEDALAMLTMVFLITISGVGIAMLMHTCISAYAKEQAILDFNKRGVK